MTEKVHLVQLVITPGLFEPSDKCPAFVSTADDIVSAEYVNSDMIKDKDFMLERARDMMLAYLRRENGKSWPG